MASVLYVHQDGVLSGSAISLAHTIGALDRTRHAPAVLLAREGPARGLFESLGTRVDVVPAHGFWTSPSLPPYHPDYYRNFRALRRNPALERYLHDTKPDIVHINDKAMLAAGLAAERVGLPVVWHLRSAYAGGRSRVLNAVSRRVISRVARRAIAISEDEVEGFDRGLPVEVIHNAVDLESAAAAISQREQTRAELGLAPDEVAVCMVGFLTATKGAWDFVEAAGIVRRRLPGTKLRFVIAAPIPGREPLNWGIRGRLGLVDKTHPEDRLRMLAARAGIDDAMLLTGRRDDMLRVLAATDVVSACYRLWAIGRPALEAAAVGRPVVVNAGHSGRSSIVRHGETGLVVPRGDAVALAEALVALAASPSRREQLGQAARAHADRHFDVHRNTRRVEAVYDTLLGSNRT